MMKNLIKKLSLLCLVLILVMTVFVSAGCGASGGDENGGESTDSSYEEDEGEDVEEAEAPDYDLDYYQRFMGKGMEINVYNWGEYMSDGSDGLMDVNAEFEDLTGIKVNYLNYETCEAMYAKLKSGANAYDVVFPSDYMVSRLIQEDMLLELDYDNIPNMKYIDETLLNPAYDPDQKYSIPFAWSRIAIIYNAMKVDREVDGWDILWDEDYAGDILMFKNSRDAFGVAEMKLGYDINTENRDELDSAAELLKKQKPLVQAYVMDQVFDKMQNGEAAVAVYYVGDYYLMLEINEDLEICVPDATNVFVDAACIPSCSKNKEAAEMYINFLNEPQVAADNAEYIMYSTPNLAAKDLLDEEITENPLMYPDAEDMSNDVAYVNLSTDTNLYLDELWTEVLAEEENYNKWVMPVFVVVSILFIIFNNIRKKRKQKLERREAPGNRRPGE